MQLTIHIAESIRCVAKGLPETIVVVRDGPATIRQVARDAGIPPILIVFAIVDGTRKGLEDAVDKDTKIHLVGSMAGG